ncbi:unnamed protein product [Hermetia illucens]|uniref:Uncharacterized protein n=1 Tax=Hermetia illucens TaxID=343691 RepID=A0A7R8V520_HERIL|nr:unnamed protein product [Hermetia illucens]
MDTSTESMSSTIDTTETESTETSSKETSTTEGTTGKSTTDEPTTESSTEDMVTQSSTEETSTESSSSEVTSTSSSSIETSSTDKEMESKTTSSETDSTMCTLEASTMPVERHIVFKRAVRANNNEEEDARRVVNVLNEVTDFASKWALPISAFKSKLQYFEKNLVNGKFPSKFFERKVTPKLQANIRRIRGRISNYMVEATDATDLENINILMKAIYELPQVLIQSLVG